MNEKPWQFKRGQTAWNKGTGKCQRGHPPERYVTPPSGVQICLDCKRENGRKYRNANREKINFRQKLSKYELSPEEFHALWNKQEGKCAICRDDFSEVIHRIDHDHKTGAVRGLLCPACNTALGLFKDSTNVLNNAARYLNGN